MKTSNSYQPAPTRYDNMQYNRVGKSGLKLPAISLGLWHNFGDHDSQETAQDMIFRAFDLGITHFDLANNYGPPPGSAESNFGRILSQDLKAHRDELIISTKAGWDMWPGPYGNFGSRKYLIASLDQSLQRMGLDYVDIFYHHRPDPETPLEETMAALDHIVRQGKALYVGISQYNPEQTRHAARILRDLGTPCLIHQPNYNMFDRWIENGLTTAVQDEGIGCIVFSPLAQGMLTNKYINGVPADSRAAGKSVFLTQNSLSEEKLAKIRQLNVMAQTRNQSLAQMAIAWVLNNPAVTSSLIGASKVSQIEEIVKALDNRSFNEAELHQIDQVLAG
ncbi:MAG: L-glyceraldehyde 3-phosphate reductase [Cellvibrionaceae bacterium]|jgi:L-glyceraldehyde 3-phosphate reductase